LAVGEPFFDRLEASTVPGPLGVLEQPPRTSANADVNIASKAIEKDSFCIEPP